MLNLTKPATGDIGLGEVAGLQISAGRSAIAGSVALWVFYTLLGRRIERMTFPAAAAGGLVAVLLHWLADMVHQYGHSRAAAMAGYPMTGIRLWGIFSTSQYPADEPELPARIHTQRALGGPAISVLAGLLVAPLALAARQGSALRALGVLAVLENLVLFGLGAFMPLGFTDGSTLLRWWPKLREERGEAVRGELSLHG